MDHTDAPAATVAVEISSGSGGSASTATDSSNPQPLGTATRVAYPSRQRNTDSKASPSSGLLRPLQSAETLSPLSAPHHQRCRCQTARDPQWQRGVIVPSGGGATCGPTKGIGGIGV